MHTFEINIGNLSTPVKGAGYIEVNPLIAGNGIVKYRDEKNFYKIRKKLKSELTFTGEEYRALIQLRDSESKFIELKIYNNSVLKLYGYLLFSGLWDENKNMCSMLFQTVDNYSELEQNLEVETNILALAKTSVFMTQESIVYEVTLPCYAGSRIESTLYYDPDGQVSQDPGEAHPDWAYYLSNGEQSGCPPSSYSYKFITTYVTFAHPDYTKSQLYAEWYIKAASSSETASIELDRAVSEYSILENLLGKADSALSISKSAYSDYINDIDNEIYNMYFFDKSDVKRYDSVSPASYQYIRLNEILNYYSKWLNLHYNIDESNNFTLKFINDLTEANYATYPAHDLTTFKNINWTNNQKRYVNDVSNKTSKEILTFETTGSYFDYELFFDNVIEESFIRYNNDVAYLISDPEEVDDDGFSVVTCNASNYIINKTPGATEIINYGMRPDRLLYDHMRNANRPYSTGKLGTSSITLTKEKDKELNYKIPIYDIDEIDFDYFIKTDIGLCIPYEFEIMFEKDFASIMMRL